MNGLEENGFTMAARFLSWDEVDHLRGELDRLAPPDPRSGGIRSLGLKSDAILELATEGLPAVLAKEALGSAARPVKITGFDKTPGSNWKVPWHQDLTIAVREARDVEGFGPWTVKDGIPHVQPPIEILSGMLAIRVRAGLGEITCPVGIMLMRPLLLHASSKSRMGEHRRVIHIEYVACDLPAGLSWGHLDVPVSPDF